MIWYSLEFVQCIINQTKLMHVKYKGTDRNQHDIILPYNEY